MTTDRQARDANAVEYAAASYNMARMPYHSPTVVGMCQVACASGYAEGWNARAALREESEKRAVAECERLGGIIRSQAAKIFDLEHPEKTWVPNAERREIK